MGDRWAFSDVLVYLARLARVVVVDVAQLSWPGLQPFQNLLIKMRDTPRCKPGLRVQACSKPSAAGASLPYHKRLPLESTPPSLAYRRTCRSVTKPPSKQAMPVKEQRSAPALPHRKDYSLRLLRVGYVPPQELRRWRGRTCFPGQRVQHLQPDQLAESWNKRERRRLWAACQHQPSTPASVWREVHLLILRDIQFLHWEKAGACLIVLPQTSLLPVFCKRITNFRGEDADV